MPNEKVMFETASGESKTLEASHRRAEDELRKFRRQMETIFNNATVANFVMDERQHCTYMNPAAEKLTGFTLAEMQGQPFHNFVHHTRPDDSPYPREECPIDRAFQRNNKAQGEDVFVHKDGSFYPVAFTASPIREGETLVGTIIEVRGTAVEKQAERRAQFLSDLNHALQPLIEPDEIMHVAARMLGEHLGVNRCAYAEVEADEDHFRITGDYTRDTFSIVGRYQMASFSAEALRLSRENLPFVVDDVDRDARVQSNLDAYRQTEIAAVVSMPLHKAGRFVAGMGLHQKTPRHWTGGEIELIQRVINRCWESIERARGARRLRESEERLQTVFEHMTEGLVISELDGQLIYWNRAALDMHGFQNPDEFLLRVPEFESIFEFSYLDGPVLTVAEWPFSRIFSGEILRDFEVRVRRKDIDWKRVYSYSGSLVREPSGKPLAFVTITDLTERKRAEEALRESEERLRLTLDATKLGTWESIPETGERRWSDQAKSIFGLPKSAPVNAKKIYERIAPEDRERINETMRRALRPESGGELHIQYRLLGGEDGPDRWVESHGRAYFDGGRAVRLIGTILDITERKLVEESLRLSEAQFRTMANSIPQLAWIAHADGFIFWYNQRWHEYTGTTPKDMEGWGWQSVHDPEVLPTVLERWQGAIATGQPFEMELLLRGADGRFRVFLTRVQPVNDSQGRVVQWFGTNTDVDELKRIEEEVRTLNEELEQRVTDRTAQLETANKELEAFSYSVSHDLRAPLRHINGFSQALLEDYSDKLDDEGKGFLQEVRGATREMAQLIDDMLQLSRVTRSEMHREVVNLSDEAREVMGELRQRDPAHEPLFTVEEGLFARCDKRLLRVVLNNLLGNAWKFTSKRERAKIAFGREEKDGEAVYYVRDNGAGFDMAFADKLFGAFQRLHSASEFEGTGIGLATVQRIVNRHGGRIRAEGEVNRGAAFYFTLPHSKEL